jgi:hypothetical protein
MKWPSRRLLFAASLAVPLLASGQALHQKPRWPTDGEFLSVNQVVETACQRHRSVDEQLVWALIWQESKYDPLALGLKGEVGLGQLMPGTASALGVRDRTSITESVEASVGHLAHLHRKYKGNIRLVLAAYNAGEPAVDRCRCVPASSRAYVDRIEQNRLFAERIVEYLHKSLIPSASQQNHIRQLEEQLATLQNARRESPDSALATELSKTRAALDAAEADVEAVRSQRSRLLVEIQQSNSIGAQALAMTDSLRKRLDEVETRVGTSGPQPGTEAGTELEGIRSELAELKSVIQDRNVQDTRTQQRLAELSAAVARFSDKPMPLTAPSKNRSDRPAMVALITAFTLQGRLMPDSSFSGVLQDALLRRGLGVNVELETPEFLAHNLDSLLSGHGKSLRKTKAKNGSQWDYVMVLRLIGKPVPNEVTDTVAYAVTADSRLYTRQGDLVLMRSFSETGAGFSEPQARESATSRLGQEVSEYIHSSIAH